VVKCVEYGVTHAWVASNDEAGVRATQIFLCFPLLPRLLSIFLVILEEGLFPQ